MKTLRVIFLALACAALAPAASAYQLQGSGCNADGSACNVYCDNGQLAGAMNWNGSVWTDGVKWDADKDGEARKIVAANGTACT
jgi:hypothetical protein